MNGVFFTPYCQEVTAPIIAHESAAMQIGAQLQEAALPFSTSIFPLLIHICNRASRWIYLGMAPSQGLRGWREEAPPAICEELLWNICGASPRPLFPLLSSSS